MGNKTFIFKKPPTALPVPGEHLTVEERPFDPEAAPPAGGITTENLYASFDPYLRGRMRAAQLKHYNTPFELDGPITNAVLAKVLKSDSPDYKSGDLIIAYIPIAEYGVIEDLSLVRSKIEDPNGVKNAAWYLGPLGMPGLTAYSSLYEIGKPKKGETIYINSAAGAVGQIVGQIAKREGLRVIGSVGSDEKLDFIINELGFDGGFNYKKEKPSDAFERLVPDGFDILYENVGGEQMEAALEVMKHNGRVIICGMISEYNKKPEERYGIKNLRQVLNLRLTVRGFIVSDADFGPKYKDEFIKNVSKWLNEGSVRAKLHETVGIENAAEGFVGLLQGENFGKAILKIKV